MLCSICQAENDPAASHCLACGEPLKGGTTIQEGFLLASRYEIRSVLGKGGMGMVYRAHDRLLNEPVAIKVLRPDIAGSSVMAQRFIAELKLARSVSHKNVCRIHEYGEHQGLRFISMAFVDGVDLRQVLRQRGRLPPREAYAVLVDVAAGLQAVHDEGIVHRDLKTANIMRDGKGVVRLMDFGIAKQWDAGDAEKMTQTGQVVGTPDYMSPEQIRGQPTDARSDIYALGVILFELLTGETPFRAESPVATVLKQLKEPPPLEAAGLPAPVRPVLERALAKDPALRYPTARDFGAALERLLARSDETATTFVPRLPETLRDAPPTRPWAASMGAGETDSIVAERAVPPARPGRATSRRIGWVGALLVVAALGGLILVGRWMSERRTEGDRVPESTEVTLPPATLPTEDRLPEPTPTAAPVETARSEGVARPAPQASDRSRLSESPLNEARSALERGDYDAALQRAQAILGADPGNTDARGVSEKAAAGKAAGEHLGSATRLLQEGKHGEALDEVALARQLAPWDARAAALATRIREAQARAGRSRVEGLLSQAEKALVAADYDAAIRLYDAVLEADPNNSIAKMSRATAINARVAERALSTAPEAPSGRRLVAGKAEAVEGGKEPELSDAFELTPDIAVTRDTVDAALPGRIEFESTPEVLRAGDSYSLRILLDNRGRAPIGIREVIVTSTVNGKRSTGPVPVLATEVAPGQKATLLSLSDFLRDDTREWTMEVLVRTTRGEAYRRRLVWK